MYYLETGYDKHTRFRNAVLLAMTVHVVVLLGVSFEFSSSAQQSQQIEVTLANRPSTAAPDDARLIAQSNQEGSGDEAEMDQDNSRNHLPTDAPTAQQDLPQLKSEESAAQKETLTTDALARHTAMTRPDEDNRQESKLDGVSPEAARLSAELASLQAEIDEQTRSFADKPRVRRLSNASAKQSADAAYLLDWRRRLEAVGNQYYPEASIRYGIYGDVRLLVVILQDGSLEEVKVLSSSGFAVLDEAAIKVVRMAAPFAPFPAELRATTDKLEIVRTWQYLENELSSD